MRLPLISINIIDSVSMPMLQDTTYWAAWAPAQSDSVSIQCQLVSTLYQLCIKSAVSSKGQKSSLRSKVTLQKKKIFLLFMVQNHCRSRIRARKNLSDT